MANSPSEVSRHRFTAPDGVDLVWHEMGKGRPLVLIHGFFSNAFTNWIRYGHAARLVEAGFRVIMPDLRAHGDSAKPHDPAAYPPDILAEDGLALIDYLELGDYDLGGYSLGCRTAVRMIVKGARPRRAVFSGMGLQGIVDTKGRGAYFRHVLSNLGSFERGTQEWMTEAFLKTTKGDPEALLLILDTFVDTPVEALSAIEMPALVLIGGEDDDNGSAAALAEALPDGRLVTIAGDHMSVVVRPQLGQAIAAFLS